MLFFANIMLSTKLVYVIYFQWFCLIFYRFGLSFLFGFSRFEMGLFVRKIVNLFSFDLLFFEIFFKKKK